jgi:phosphoribosylaminoimidazolecarboxamide formyltransferase/IMP cyclohydrolase
MTERRIALLSVYDKAGIVEFARDLLALGFDLISSGGTAKVLADAGVPVRDVADISGLQPILDHRVVTLVPQVHGGLLAKDTEAHRLDLAKINAPWIDLVCVDLYPLEDAIRSGGTSEQVIEKTDIGGPTLLSSAAKGRRIVICDPTDRSRVLAWLKDGEPDRNAFLNELAAKADGVIAGYRLASARFHSGGRIDGFVGTQTLECKYGENAWQAPAGLFSTGTDDPLAIDKFKLIAGTPPSYNNICDIDRALQTLSHMMGILPIAPANQMFCAVGVKHGNACGAGYSGTSKEDALHKMVKGDRRAIFGGSVMMNFPLDASLAETLLSAELLPGETRRLLDAIMAPSFSDEAVQMLQRKGDKCRFLANPSLELAYIDRVPRFRYVRGGFLRQPNYVFVPGSIVVEGKPSKDALNDALMAWAVGSTSNSNTITLVKDGMLLGNAVGQQDRVGACKLAIQRARDAGHALQGAVAYSDSFFPFPDGPALLADAGIRTIFTSTGSVRDKETIALCEKRGVSLILVPDSQGRGFFGH